jgi:hypothetical protein
MGGVAVFLIAALNVTVVSEYLKLAPIGAVPVLCLASAAAAATSWMELRKHLKRCAANCNK